MPLHPHAIEAIRRAGDLPAHLPPAELRQVYEAQRIPLVADALPIASCDELTIPSRGGPLPLRIYRPLAQSQGAPLMVFFHGGGWMVGSLHSYDAAVRRLTAKTGCVVVSVGYRLAPEAVFPAAVEDCWDAFTWSAEHAAELGADNTKMVVCGDSAGGNLAAAIAQMGLDSCKQHIALQVLIYPSTDMSRPWPSFERNGKGNMLTAAAVEIFVNQYAPDPADRLDPRASPMRRPDLSGLPRALIVSAEFDPLVDDNQAYAECLERAGVPVRYVCFPGMIHPFFTLSRVISDAEKLEDLIAVAVGEIADRVIP